MSELEFSEDSVMGDGDNPEFDAFLEYIQTLEDEYYSESRTFVLDVNKLTDLKKTLLSVTRIMKTIDAKAKITYEGCNPHTIPVEKNAFIYIEIKRIHVKNVQEFIDAICPSSTISIIPLIDKRVLLCIGFNNILKELET